MPKRHPKDGPGKLRPDVAETAHRTLLEAIGEAPRTAPPEERTEKNPEAVKHGAAGGKAGGRARVASLTKAQRSEIAKKAAAARWRLDR